GRAPGTDQRTVRALRRDWASADEFPQDVLELQALLGPPEPGQPVVAVPGAGSNVPLWILGSSLYGAQLAAMLGLPYAFASHFAPAALLEALKVYRSTFKPSAQQGTSYAMAGVHVVAADTDAEAKRLFTSTQQQFTNMVRNRRGKLQPPIDDIETYWTPQEKAQANSMMHYAMYGSPETVRRGLEAFIAMTRVDELMVVSAIYDHAARLRSYEILAGLSSSLRSTTGEPA
ncbi:MAG TPA: MsnO8 family LLM class oxidoreductase, partial [Burkholderiales bacterium]|nr:MsnO8 family LLM class oxidoreductase [Burkholderiales bacterium]